MAPDLEREGNFNDVNFPEIILGIHQARKTGMLRAENGSIIKVVYFREGEISFASSNEERDRLGHVFIRAGKLTDEQLEVAMARVDAKTSLGKTFISLGYITPKELLWGARRQVDDILQSLYIWREGRFQFIEGPLPKKIANLRLPTPQVIARTILAVDDRGWILERLGSLDTVFSTRRGAFDEVRALELGDEIEAIVAKVDGERSVRDVCATAQADDFTVSKVLYALHVLGVLEVERPDEASDDRDLSALGGGADPMGLSSLSDDMNFSDLFSDDEPRAVPTFTAEVGSAADTVVIEVPPIAPDAGSETMTISAEEAADLRSQVRRSVAEVPAGDETVHLAAYDSTAGEETPIERDPGPPAEESPEEETSFRNLFDEEPAKPVLDDEGGADFQLHEEPAPAELGIDRVEVPAIESDEMTIVGGGWESPDEPETEATPAVAELEPAPAASSDDAPFSLDEGDDTLGGGDEDGAGDDGDRSPLLSWMEEGPAASDDSEATFVATPPTEPEPTLEEMLARGEAEASGAEVVDAPAVDGAAGTGGPSEPVEVPEATSARTDFSDLFRDDASSDAFQPLGAPPPAKAPARPPAPVTRPQPPPAPRSQPTAARPSRLPLLAASILIPVIVGVFVYINWDMLSPYLPETVVAMFGGGGVEPGPVPAPTLEPLPGEPGFTPRIVGSPTPEVGETPMSGAPDEPGLTPAPDATPTVDETPAAATPDVPMSGVPADEGRSSGTAVLNARGQELVGRGEYAEAARVFKEMVAAEKGRRYAIQLELDCQESSLADAVRHGGRDASLFFVPRQLGSRSCYAVFWGLYANESAASAQISGVPRALVESGAKPHVVRVE